MRPLDLEFYPAPRRMPWLLAAALAAAVAAFYPGLKPAPAPAPVVATPRAENAEELAFTRETLARMSVPWNDLFRALERSRTEGVLLLSVEPNSESRTLRVTGEAKSYLAALSYLATLSEREVLQKVHLVRHESRGEAVVFAILATWKAAAEPRGVHDLRELQRFLDRERSIDEWLAKLYGIATAKGLRLRQADYRLADSRYGIDRYQMILPLNATYTEVRAFLDAALVEIPVLSLDQAAFRRRNAAEPRVDAELAMTLYVRRK